MFTAYVRTKAGKITLCAMPRKWRDVEETAAKMSKVPDIERVSVAAYGRIIASFKDGVRIDLEAPSSRRRVEFVGRNSRDTGIQG